MYRGKEFQGEGEKRNAGEREASSFRGSIADHQNSVLHPPFRLEPRAAEGGGVQLIYLTLECCSVIHESAVCVYHFLYSLPDGAINVNPLGGNDSEHYHIHDVDLECQLPNK